VDERQPRAGAVAEGAKEKRGLMFLCAVPSLLWCAARRLVQPHDRTDQDPLIQKSSWKRFVDRQAAFRPLRRGARKRICDARLRPRRRDRRPSEPLD
jgi:hypothetical protein